MSKMRTAQPLHLREAHPEAVEVMKVQPGDRRRPVGSVKLLLEFDKASFLKLVKYTVQQKFELSQSEF